MIRALLLVERMRPKSPGAITWPVLGSIFPPEEGIALKLLMGLARFTWLRKLKKSARNSMSLDSAKRNRLVMAKSTFTWLGPRRQLRPTIPRSVPVADATAIPRELGMASPLSTIGRANANALKNSPSGALLVAVSHVAPGAKLDRTSGLLPPASP